MTFTVLPKLVTAIHRATAVTGHAPARLRVTQAVYDDALDELRQWLEDHDEPDVVLSAPIDRRNFILCGVPVVVEHS